MKTQFPRIEECKSGNWGGGSREREDWDKGFLVGQCGKGLTFEV